MWREADFVGGHPALDFLNTVSDTGKTRSRSKLTDWSELRRWAASSKILTETRIQRFEEAGRFDDLAAFAELIDLRETAYAALLAHTDQGSPDLEAMSVLNDRVRAALGRCTLELEGGRFRWLSDPASYHRWTDTIALAFEDLLRSDDCTRVHQCRRCTWFFIDRGRGSGRRWCDMRTCGNRAKAQAFRASQSDIA